MRRKRGLYVVMTRPPHPDGEFVELEDTGAPLRDEDVQSTVRFLGTYATWLPRLEVWNVRHVWMEG